MEDWKLKTMKIKKYLAKISFILLLCLMFASCHEATFPEDKYSKYMLTMEGMYKPVEYTNSFYSFSQNKQVYDTDDWDIVFRGAYPFTNSGVTASNDPQYGLDSGGSGGWYYTGKKGLDTLTDMTIDDVPDDPGVFKTDYTAYISEMSGPVNQLCNDMMLLTTTQGSGTQADPYDYDMANMADSSDDLAAIKIKNMPPDYQTTERIYIIKCHDGTGYGAFMFKDVAQGFGGVSEYYATFYAKYLGSK